MADGTEPRLVGELRLVTVYQRVPGLTPDVAISGRPLVTFRGEPVGRTVSVQTVKDGIYVVIQLDPGFALPDPQEFSIQ